MSHILLEKGVAPGVALIRLNRPESLNALNRALVADLTQMLLDLDQDSEVRAIVITGNERAFAAGADIKEMAGDSAIDMLILDQFQKWDQIKRLKKPLIAAVSGYALGGGCELAMLCDIIIASETAQFGQPEIKIGVIPGAGGTQRLTRAIGKSRAMEYILTGRFFSAQQAYEWGLVSRVVPVELYLEEAIKLAAEIASMPPLAVQLAKQAILKSYELSLEEGLHFERRNFYLLFATEDQKEGMKAFIEKRPPQWKGR
ncbi:MAG: enoyl-CoA hydratase-related protein [Bacteroidota bacterium]|nr:enoyl-CoA hydratase-related protein [Bacteroidota bacterium]